MGDTTHEQTDEMMDGHSAPSKLSSLEALVVSVTEHERAKPDFEAFERREIHRRIDELIDDFAENIVNLAVDDAVDEILQKSNAIVTSAQQRGGRPGEKPPVQAQYRIQDLERRLANVKDALEDLREKHRLSKKRIGMLEEELAELRLTTRSYGYLFSTFFSRVLGTLGLRRGG